MAIVKDDLILASDYNAQAKFEYKTFLNTPASILFGATTFTHIMGLPPYGQLTFSCTQSFFSNSGNESKYRLRNRGDETWGPYVVIPSSGYLPGDPAVTVLDETLGVWRDIEIAQVMDNSFIPNFNWMKNVISVKNTTTAGQFIKVFSTDYTSFLGSPSKITADLALRQQLGGSDA